MKKRIIHDVHSTVFTTKDLLSETVSFIFRYKIILIYPVLATVITLLSLPLISGFIAAIIATIVSVFSIDISRLVITYISAVLLIIYIAVISGVFTCLISSAVLVRLENNHTILFAGLIKALPKFRRIIRFGLTSPLFGIIYLITSRPKTIAQTWTMITTSLSINTAIVAPGIINTNKSLVTTLHDSTDILRRGWKQQLLFKGLLYMVVIALLFVSFLPAYLAERASNVDPAAESVVRWAVSALLWTLLFIATKVISSVFTTILYYRMK